jgi:hypothetical protein
MVDIPSVIIKDDYGTKWWRVSGKLHREDGPAIEWGNGRKEWWWQGWRLTFNDWLDQNTDMTDEEKVMFKLEHG